MQRLPVFHRLASRACFIGALSALACGKSEETEVKSTGPIVSVLDLAVSLRSRASAPQNPHDIEIGSTAINVGGEAVLALTDGQFAPAEAAGGQVPKLAAALTKTPHPSAVLSVSSSISYNTVAHVLSTLKAAGVNSVSFKVRAPGSTSNTGFLTLDNFSVRPKSKNEDDIAIAGATTKPWSDFSAKWEEVQSACRASPTGNCAYKPELIAEGGNLKVVLYAAGQGANVAFYRVGAPPPPPPVAEPEKKAKKGKGGKSAKSKTVDPVAELEQAPPATEAGFQFRSQEATTASSAISETMRPVCGASACGVAVQGEKATLFVRVLSLIGAAFPDGTTAPVVAFELP